MKLRSLQLRNWLLFQEADITFNGVGNVIGVVGEYADESARSNRSGKSTITEAIPYLFYGKGRGKQLQLINRSAIEDGEDMLVSGVVALADGREFTIKRGRTYDNKPILEVEGLEGAKVADADQFLAELIGFDRSEYTSTCFFEQGDIHAFMVAQPAEKRALIQRWLRQERWSVRQKYADERVKELRSETEGYKLALQSLSTAADGKSIADLKAQLKEANRKHSKAKERLDRISSDRDSIRDEITSLERECESYDRLDTINAKLKREREKLSTARKKSKIRQKAESRRERSHEAWEDLRGEVDAETSKRKGEITGHQAELRSVETRLDKLSGLKGVCPFLEAECNRVGNEAVEPLRKTAQSTKRHLMTLCYELEEYEKEQGASLRELRKAVKTAEREIKAHEFPAPSYFKDAIKELEDEAEALATKLTTDRDQLDERIRELNHEIANMRQQIVAARELSDEATGDVARSKAELEQAEQAQQRRTELEKKLAQAEQDKACWSYCKYMFGPRGIPGAIMESNFSALESDINFILERMNTNLSTRFLPYRETQKWEETCVACGWKFEATKQRQCDKCKEARQRKRVDQLILQVVDEYEGQISEFGLDSGGGKTLLSFAVRLALMFMKVRESTGDIPPVVLDEVLADLDPINRAAVLDMVTNVLVKRFGVGQVLVISHNREVQESLEDVLVVTRHNFHSEVGWA
jgi:DNA repair exonuclease SbcCD ATPase subunit